MATHGPIVEPEFPNQLLNTMSTSSRAVTPRYALAALWILALYFIRDPYRGVRHDAVLYFAQMQHRLTPGWLDGDLFFLSNSQDRFSVFSTIFSPVLQALGLSSAEIVILLALHALFLFATWQLTAGMPATTRWCSLVLALALPHFYSSQHRFAFAEPYLTARSLAEPFAVLALAMLLRGRLALALAAALFAAVSHPLMALPAWLVGWRLLCGQDRRWNWAALLALPVALLAWADVGPFGALAHGYDPAWLATVKMADAFVFLGTWQIADWQQLLFDGGLLWLCARDASLPLGRLAGATLVTTIGCLLASAIGVDLLHNVLLTQLQLWRATWVAHLVAMLSLGPLLIRFWTQDRKGRLAVFMVLLGAITVSSTVHTAWVVGLMAFGAVAVAQSRVVVSVAVVRVGIAACICAAVLISGVVAASQFDQLSMGRDSGILIGRASAIPSTLSALVLSIALLGLWPLLQPSRVATACSAIAVAVLLAAGISQWDQRSDWARYVEQSQGRPHPFDAVIPAGATVYWPDDLMASWALLGRSSFFDPAQMSGTVYSRATSVAGMERRDAVNPLVIQSRLCMSVVATGLSSMTAADCKPTDLAVHDVCHLKNVHPDFIVLNSPIEAPPLASWQHPLPDASEPAGHFLYACSKMP
jgi:hypothetical protein